MKKLIAVIAILFLAGFGHAQEKFIRLTHDDDKNPVALQTAITTYKNAKGQTVDLIACIHVGDRKYYKAQNKLFKTYDKLCYELVAPEGARPTRDSSFAWKIAKNFLRFEHQLEHIDYSATNFVHADMSPIEIMALIKKRGDTQFTFFLKVMAESMANQKNDEDQQIDLMKILEDPNYLKRKMVKQLTSETSLGKTLDQVIVKDRNIKALKVVQDQLKNHNKIGLYYGAAHMPDFDERLLKLGFKREGTKWITAWDME